MMNLSLFIGVYLFILLSELHEKVQLIPLFTLQFSKYLMAVLGVFSKWSIISLFNNSCSYSFQTLYHAPGESLTGVPWLSQIQAQISYRNNT